AAGPDVAERVARHAERRDRERDAGDDVAGGIDLRELVRRAGELGRPQVVADLRAERSRAEEHERKGGAEVHGWGERNWTPLPLAGRVVRLAAEAERMLGTRKKGVNQRGGAARHRRASERQVPRARQVQRCTRTVETRRSGARVAGPLQASDVVFSEAGAHRTGRTRAVGGSRGLRGDVSTVCCSTACCAPRTLV